MPDAIRVEKNGPIGTVILHRPAVRNAVDPPTAAALAQACLRLDRDPHIQALVLWGEGGIFRLPRFVGEDRGDQPVD